LGCTAREARKGGLRHAATNWVKQYDASTICRPLESTAVRLATNLQPSGHFTWQCQRDPLMDRATALAPGFCSSRWGRRQLARRSRDPGTAPGVGGWVEPRNRTPNRGRLPPGPGGAPAASSKLPPLPAPSAAAAASSTATCTAPHSNIYVLYICSRYLHRR
jgi:hypothetical protein